MPSPFKSRDRRSRKSCFITAFICARPSRRRGSSKRVREVSNAAAVKRSGNGQPTGCALRVSCDHALSQTCHRYNGNCQCKSRARRCSWRTPLPNATSSAAWVMFNAQTTPSSARQRLSPAHCVGNDRASTAWALPPHSRTVPWPSSQNCPARVGAMASISAGSPTTSSRRTLRRQKKP
ncbi:hypothetical protein [Pseudomonas sp. 37 R 15]|nr:hypothetical protein [Pseudomonas sp. 37 R 15]